MNINEALSKLVAGKDLSQDQMASVMTQVMTGEASPAQIAGLLVALRMKGEAVDEITGAAQVMRQLATPVHIKGEHLVDTCGTGGDGANIFNVSTAAAFVAAAAGAHVAKHGNRSVSSSTGSADVLEAAGVDLSIQPDHVARAVDTLGVGFMFAPAHHGAMKHAIGPRKELGMRTIFNLLGPMTNPAGVKRQVMGVFDQALCRPLAEVLQRLGSEHVMVVHAEDGLDEFSIASASHVAELKDDQISEYTINADQLGLRTYSNLDGLSVSSAEQSLALIRSVFQQERTENVEKASAMIVLNAGAAIYVSGISSSFAEGCQLAEDAIASGGASEKLRSLAQFTQAIN